MKQACSFIMQNAQTEYYISITLQFNFIQKLINQKQTVQTVVLGCIVEDILGLCPFKGGNKQ